MMNPTTTLTAQNFVLIGSRDPLDIAKLDMVLAHLLTNPEAYNSLHRVDLLVGKHRFMLAPSWREQLALLAMPGMADPQTRFDKFSFKN